ncbi:hypothetical protein [Streptomyces sp. NPDC001435]|uniref:hypothetical protein n=1 Tax=Streptomyces sp. NPDC001435 TaxID=3364576 RepID=UPI0036C5CBE6
MDGPTTAEVEHAAAAAQDRDVHPLAPARVADRLGVDPGVGRAPGRSPNARPPTARTGWPNRPGGPSG